MHLWCLFSTCRSWWCLSAQGPELQDRLTCTSLWDGYRGSYSMKVGYDWQQVTFTIIDLDFEQIKIGSWGVSKYWLDGIIWKELTNLLTLHWPILSHWINCLLSHYWYWITDLTVCCPITGTESLNECLLTHHWYWITDLTFCCPITGTESLI